MCGTNTGSQLKLVNTVNVGVNKGGSGGITLQATQGAGSTQMPDFAIAEVMVWDRGLTSSEMFEASYYLMDKFGIEPRPPSLPSLAWYKSETLLDLPCPQTSDSTVSHSA